MITYIVQHSYVLVTGVRLDTNFTGFKWNSKPNKGNNMQTTEVTIL